MDLPKLVPGRRYTLPRPAGSADSLLLAQLATREKAAGRLTAIVTADATDAQRLIDEMAFFAPDLRCALFPDWETLPYDTFSPHQDLISERLATLWRIQQRDKDTGADVVFVPATTALYRLAPPAFLAGYTFHFKVKQKLDEAKLKGQLTLAGYSHVTQVVSPGEYAVRGGLIDLFPMGSPCPTAWTCSTTRSTASAPSTPTASAACTRCPRCACCPAASSRWTKRRAPKLPQPLARDCWKATPPSSRIYKDMGNGVATAGIEYYLPLFFDDTATVFDYLGADATVVLHGDLEPAFQHFWQDTRTATAWCRATRTPGAAA
jgi:transcription-repair coupling factor (superfamily II helicase)